MRKGDPMKARSFLCKIKDIKLTSKLLALYVVMILLFVGSTVLYYCGSYDALVREGQMLSDILVKQTKSSLATSMDNIMRAIFDTYNVRLLSSCLPGRDANENYYAYAYSVQNSLIEFLSLADNVNWIVAVDANDEAFYSSRRFSPRINYAYRENLQRDKADCMNFQGRLLWRRQEDGTINVSRMLFALPSMRYTGYVIVNIDADVFGQDAQPLANAGSIVFDSYGTPMLYTLNDSMLPLLELDPGSRNDPAIDTQTYSLSWESITNSSLWLCQIVNLGYAPQEMRRLIGMYVTACSGILLLASSVMLAIFRQIKRNITTVQNGITAIASGDLNCVIVPDAMDEIGMIGNSINSMAGNIKELMRKVEEESLLRRQAEYSQLEFQYSALQAQINPHFLFNALESISGLAKLNNDMQTSHATQCLAGIFRQNLERAGSLCPLIDEIQYIRMYLEMYKIMYPQHLRYVIEHDPDMDDIAVPAFLLQPIVENAIVHGISPKAEGGCVRITTGFNGERLIIQVEDDGCGFSQERLAAVFAHKSDEAGRKPRIGLYNVQQRIQLFYGPEYGIEIQTEEGKGTVCKISLPV